MKIPLHVTNNASVYRYGQERPAGRLHASRPPNTGLAAFLAAFLIDMEEQHYFGSGLQGSFASVPLHWADNGWDTDWPSKLKIRHARRAPYPLHPEL